VSRFTVRAAPWWDHLLVDQDDPEKRLAGLEDQPAERQRVADRLPVRPGESAALGRFVASAAPMTSRRRVTFIFGMFAAFMLLCLVFNFVIPADTSSIAGIPIFLILVGIWVIGGSALYFGFPDLVGRAPRRNVVIGVTGDGLTVNRRRGEVVSFSDAQLGPWDFSVGGMKAGMALHLRRGAQSFVLGGRDHRIANRTRLGAPPTDRINAWMWAADFDELLALVAPRYGWDLRGSEAGEPTRCLLIPKSASGFGNPIPNPTLGVDLGNNALSVIHLNTSAPVVSASLDQVTATPAQYVFHQGERGSSFPRVALVLRIPGMQMLSIGCPAARGLWWGNVPRRGADRFSWRVEAMDWQEKPAYWVSATDWLTLVEKFGLTSQLQDRARA
jgi:hypothetical protein